MRAKELKEYIVNNNKLVDILEALGMKYVNTSNPKYISCGMPDGDNPSSTIIYNDSFLTVNAYTRKLPTELGRNSNIFNLIMFVNNMSFSQAVSWTHAILGLNNTITISQKEDYSSKYKKYKPKIKNKSSIREQIYYNLDILNGYIKTPHIELIRDGIFNQSIIEKYKILFDDKSNRIIFPHFKHDDESKICGISGRTVIKAYKEMKIQKYMSMLPTEYIKTQNIYALSLNKKNIESKGVVIVFEAEKSVIKADQMGFDNGVAVGCHSISEIQAKILLGLNVEVCIAFDKDVPECEIQAICDRFLNTGRTISYIYDKWDLLKAKDSPVDRGYKRWNFLYKHRIKYTGSKEETETSGIHLIK